MKLKLALFLALSVSLLLLAGCVKETSLVLPYKEKLDRAVESDVDGDGAVDSWTYVFKPVQLDNHSIARVVKVTALREKRLEYESTGAQPISSSALVDARARLEAFDSSRKYGEASCKKLLGIEQGCSDAEGCARLCTTEKCSQMSGAAGGQFMEWVADFSRETARMDSGVADARAELDAISAGAAGEAELERLMDNLQSLVQHSAAVGRNNLLNPNIFVVCQPIRYEAGELQAAIDLLSNESGITVRPRTTVTIQYENFLTIEQKASGAGGYSEVKISDKVPEDLGAAASDIKLRSNFSKTIGPPLGVEWEFTSVGATDVNNTLSYSLITARPVTREWVSTSLTTPQVNIREVSFTQSPLFLSLLGSINTLFNLIAGFSNFYYALGVIIFVLYFLIAKVLLTAVRAAYFVFLAMQSNKPLKNVLYALAGHGRLETGTYFAISGLMLVLSVALISSSQVVVTDDTIVLAKLTTNLTTDPVKTFGSLFLFLGVLSLYFVLEDALKGAIIGKRYYQTPADLARASNIARYNTLSARMDALKAAAAEAEKMMMDASEENELLYTVPIDRIKEALRSGQNPQGAAVLINENISKVEAATGRLRERMGVALDHWQDWSAKISVLLARSGSVSGDMLIEVPHKFREWALERYMSEHPAESLVIEAGILRKPAAPAAPQEPKEIPALLEDLVASGKVDSAALFRKDGAVQSAYLREGVTGTVVAALSSKLLLASDLACSELNAGRIAKIRAQGEAGTLLFSIIGNNILLGTIAKEGDAALAQSAMKSVSQKIGEMLSAQQK